MNLFVRHFQAVDASKSSKQASGDPDNSAGSSGGGRRRRKLGKSAKIAGMYFAYGLF
jgi:hypothetical protein